MKACVIRERRPRRAPAINRRALVGVAERHTGIKHHVRGEIEESGHRTVPGSPGLLGAGMQTVAAREQHDGLDQTAEIGMLGEAEIAINGKEQADRRAEELEVLRVLPVARRLVLARHTDRLVEQGRSRRSRVRRQCAASDLAVSATLSVRLRWVIRAPLSQRRGQCYDWRGGLWRICRLNLLIEQPGNKSMKVLEIRCTRCRE